MQEYKDREENVASEANETLQRLKQVEEESLRNIKEHERELGGNKVKIFELEGEIKQKEIYIKEQKKQIEEVEAEKDRVGDRDADWREQIEEMEKANLHTQKDSIYYRELSQQYSSQIDKLGRELDCLKLTHEQLRKKLENNVDHLTSENKELGLSSTKMRKKINNLQLEVDKLSFENRSLKTGEEHMSGRMTQLRKTVEELEERNYKLMQSVHKEQSTKAREVRGETISALRGSEAHRHLALATEADVYVPQSTLGEPFSFRKMQGEGGRNTGAIGNIGTGSGAGNIGTGLGVRNMNMNKSRGDPNTPPPQSLSTHTLTQSPPAGELIPKPIQPRRISSSHFTSPHPSPLRLQHRLKYPLGLSSVGIRESDDLTVFDSALKSGGDSMKLGSVYTGQQSTSGGDLFSPSKSLHPKRSPSPRHTANSLEQGEDIDHQVIYIYIYIL